MHEAIPSAPARRHFLPFKRCTSRGFSSLSRVTWCWRVGGSHALSPAWRETCKNVIPAKDGLCRKISVPSVYRIKEVVAPVSWTLKVSRGWIPRSWMSEVAVSSCLTSRWRDRADAGPFCVLGRDPLVLKFALVSFPVLDEVCCSFFWELEFSHFPSSYFPRLVRFKVRAARAAVRLPWEAPASCERGLWGAEPPAAPPVDSVLACWLFSKNDQFHLCFPIAFTLFTEFSWFCKSLLYVSSLSHSCQYLFLLSFLSRSSWQTSCFTGLFP